MNRLSTYILIILIYLNIGLSNVNYEAEDGAIAIIDPQVLVGCEVTPELKYCERLESQVSRGEIRSLYVEATAYDLSYESCEKYEDDPDYGITASGEYAEIGMIAVDPDVIPMHSRCYIEGLGIVYAKDVGGAIIGNRIDIFMGSKEKCLIWGRKPVKIYILS